MRQIETHSLGTTGIRMSELGLGCASMAGSFTAVPDEDIASTVRRAIVAGITYFDMAPQYGLGRAEHLVGDALRTQRAGKIVGTKVGRLLKPYHGPDANRQEWIAPFPFEEVYDYSYDGIMRSIEDSLQRLGLSEIDIAYVHDLGAMTHGAQHVQHWNVFKDSGYRALSALRASGTVKAIGLGVNEWEILADAMEIGEWDVFLLAGRYTLLEQKALPFLDTCAERGVSIVCGGPFNGGALMGTGKWNYEDAPATVLDHVRSLETFCRERSVPIGAAALQFPLAHKAVIAVLPGPKSVAELEGILAWWNTEIPAQFWADLSASGLIARDCPFP